MRAEVGLSTWETKRRGEGRENKERKGFFKNILIRFKPTKPF